VIKTTLPASSRATAHLQSPVPFGTGDHHKRGSPIATRTASRTAEDLRRDLADGLAAAITRKGYAATTIADIVAEARVSKRTFYEHFADKEACLMALYEQSCELLIQAIERAAGSVHEGVAAYLRGLRSAPAVSRTLLVEIQAAGPRALELRQAMMRRFAGMLVALVDHELAPDLALALVGGINELMLQKATDDPTLTETVERFVQAVLSAPSPGMPPAPGELT
jgi:AcrR family transcriptional regulator